MPGVLSRLLHQTPTKYQQTYTNMETSRALGKLSVLPRELRDDIYGYLFPVGYNTLWCAHFNGKVPVFGAPSHLKAAWSKVSGFSIAILLLSRIIHDEAIMVSYSQGIFHFSSPYNNISAIPNASMMKRVMNAFGCSLPLRRHRMGAFPDSNITSRIMNVELYYDLDLDLVLDNYTGHTTQAFIPPKSVSSKTAGPIALFSGNSIQRNSGIIYLRMAEQSSYPIESIPSPLLNAIKQLTGFRTLTLKVCIWIDSFERQQIGKRNLRAGLAHLLNEMTAALAPTLGNGTTSELEIKEYWSFVWRVRPVVLQQVVFHPRDHAAESMSLTHG